MSLSRIKRPKEVLIVEDNLGDVELAFEALGESSMRNHLHAVEDGVEALAFLRREGRYRHAPRPDLILLDLNLPRKSGQEVLAEIKADEDLKRIPVVVLTTSEAQEDIIKAYNLHANCYVTKSVDFGLFIEAMKAIDHFWLKIAQLPPE